MSLLRRSARFQLKSEPADLKAVAEGGESVVKATQKKRRAGSSKRKPEQEAIAQNVDIEVEEEKHLPFTPPTKRRKTTPPPPITPLPTTTAAATIPKTPSTRLLNPHSTNAPLLTPNGGTVTFPSDPTTPTISATTTTPPMPPTTITNKTLLTTACTHLLTIAPSLGPVVKTHYCTPFSPSGLAEKIDPFHSLASSIIGQQVSGAAAKSIKNKFTTLFTTQECVQGFPTPLAVSRRDLPTLRTAGLSQRKAEYISGLAGKFLDGEITVKGLLTGSDEEVKRMLISVRGLGMWSVEMFMLFGLKRTDVFSTGDLGVQRGMARFLGRDVEGLKRKKGGGKWKYLSEREMVEGSERFRPWRSIFMWYMWRIEDVDVSAIE